MPPPEYWGPPIWTLFHVLADHVKDEHYPAVAAGLMHQIRAICRYLPCPSCAGHATEFLSKVVPGQFATKASLQDLLWGFHNFVNQRKRLPLFPRDQLEKRYAPILLSDSLQLFMARYRTTQNMKLLADDTQRRFVVRSLLKWIADHRHMFVNARELVAETTAVATATADLSDDTMATVETSVTQIDSLPTEDEHRAEMRQAAAHAAAAARTPRRAPRGLPIRPPGLMPAPSVSSMATDAMPRVPLKPPAAVRGGMTRSNVYRGFSRTRIGLL